MEIDLCNNNVVYFSANGTLPSNTSSGTLYKVIALGILVDVTDNIILDADVNMVTTLSTRFIRAQLVGMNICTDWDTILSRMDRLQVPAQKAILTALKAVRERYEKYVQNIEKRLTDRSPDCTICLQQNKG